MATVVFGLAAGWLGSWLVLQWTMGAAEQRPLYLVTTAQKVAIAVPRFMSWACFFALVVMGLWRLATAVTR